MTAIVGWIYLGLGALFLSWFIAPLLLPAPANEETRDPGEWILLVLPFMALFPIAFAFAGYRALRHPPLHRRRTLLVGFVAMLCAWRVLAYLMRQ